MVYEQFWFLPGLFPVVLVLPEVKHGFPRAVAPGFWTATQGVRVVVELCDATSCDSQGYVEL
jgi:hypothetical protein